MFKSILYTINGNKKNIMWAFKLLTGSIITVTLLFAVFLVRDFINSIDSSNLYNSDEYNIVFLDNNLFYFCLLEDNDDEFVRCNEPYYLVRKQEEVSEGKREEKIYVREPAEEEIYQPDGPIFLKKERIVYIAKIGDESAVLEYINDN